MFQQYGLQLVSINFPCVLFLCYAKSDQWFFSTKTAEFIPFYKPMLDFK